MDVGIRIKEYLESIGVSQAFLSSKTGIPTPKLNLALNGKRKLGLDEYEKICWALNVSADKFLRPRPPETPSIAS